jgi:hypothetical protein
MLVLLKVISRLHVCYTEVLVQPEELCQNHFDLV